jgi:hypothetical protein
VLKPNRVFDGLMEGATIDPWLQERMEEIKRRDLSPEDYTEAITNSFREFQKRSAKLALGDCRRQFDEGDHRALFVAIKLCAEWNWKLPKWAATAFSAGWNKFEDFEARTLDDAFDIHYAKSGHLHSDREATLKRWAIVRYIAIATMYEGRSIDLALFRSAGKEFGMSASRASDLYYSVIKDIKSGNAHKVRVFPEKSKNSRN